MAHAHVCHVTAHPGDKYAVYSYYGTFTRAMLTLFDAWTLMGSSIPKCQSLMESVKIGWTMDNHGRSWINEVPEVP